MQFHKIKYSKRLKKNMMQVPLPSNVGFKLRLTKLQGAFAPCRKTLCRRRVGCSGSLVHCTSRTHSGIHWPHANRFASFLEICMCNKMNIQLYSTILRYSSYSRIGTWKNLPSIRCSLPLCWDVQSDLAVLKYDPHGKVIAGDMTIMFPYSLQWGSSRVNTASRSCIKH